MLRFGQVTSSYRPKPCAFLGHSVVSTGADPVGVLGTGLPQMLVCGALYGSDPMKISLN